MFPFGIKNIRPTCLIDSVSLYGRSAVLVGVSAGILRDHDLRPTVAFDGLP
jgi:hypothetical protein